jgi:hypothetical protein
MSNLLPIFRTQVQRIYLVRSERKGGNVRTEVLLITTNILTKNEKMTPFHQAELGISNQGYPKWWFL